jgi:hypothetical protein
LDLIVSVPIVINILVSCIANNSILGKMNRFPGARFSQQATTAPGAIDFACFDFG